MKGNVNYSWCLFSLYLAKYSTCGGYVYQYLFVSYQLSGYHTDSAHVQV